jgi:Glycosyltransferases involved in cell wall biogenesis
LTTLITLLLYALAVPYIGLMALAVAGLFRRGPEPTDPHRPSVSVIIPAHNEERHLPGTLASLARQS